MTVFADCEGRSRPQDPAGRGPLGRLVCDRQGAIVLSTPLCRGRLVRRAADVLDERATSSECPHQTSTAEGLFA